MKKMNLATFAILGLAAVLTASSSGHAAKKTIRVLIWDEQQPIQKEAYENFLGNAIADHLRKVGAGKNGQAEITVQSVRLDDPEQGLSKANLDNADVLMWWGHQRHGEVKPETGKMITERVRSGQLSFIALHSAHFATPFFELMNARTTDDALKSLTKAEREKVKINYIPAQRRLYRKDEPLTPSWNKTVLQDGTVQLDIKLPSCAFSAVENPGIVSHIRTVMKNHPIARGVPETFDIPRTEIYDGPFYVPTPDAVVFDERWDKGAQFPAGCVWSLGKGKVFYFRPGHENYPIFKQPEVLQILENTVRWMGKK